MQKNRYGNNSVPLKNSHPEIEIVPMAFSDLDAVFNIEQKCHSHPWSKKIFLSNFGTRYFNHILMINQKVIGYFVCSSVAGEVTLMNIAIDPEYQGKGLGKALLFSLCNLSTNRSEQEIWLEVRQSNISAIKLYQALDFVEVDIRKNYYPTKTGREDAVIMCCYLTDDKA